METGRLQSPLDETLYKDVNDKFLSNQTIGVSRQWGVHLPICFKILSIKARCVQHAGDKKYPYYVYMPARYLNGFFFSTGGAGYHTLTGGQQHIHVTGDDTLYYTFKDQISMTQSSYEKELDSNSLLMVITCVFIFVPYNKAEINDVQ